MSTDFKYWAFISYSHQDSAWVEWLHRALETYRVPRRLVGRPLGAETIPRRLFPVFRDRDELPSSAELGGAINEALRRSRNLIVVCSPRSATSRWVNEEIKAFRALGRSDRIFCLIVDGEPNATDRPEIAFSECFAPALREAGFEPIAADARERKDGKLNGRLKLISGLLNVGFDELKQREQQRQFWQRIQVGAATLAFVGMVAGAWQWYQHQREAREREITIEKLVENGRLELLDGHQARAAVYLNEAYKMGYDTVPLRFMLGQAMRPVDALTNVRIKHGGGHVRRALFSPDGGRIALVVEINEKVVAKIYDSATGAEQALLEDVPPYPRVIEFLPGGERIFISGFQTSSRIDHLDSGPVSGIWDLSSREKLLSSESTAGRGGLPIQPRGNLAVMAHATRGLEIWETDKPRIKTVIDRERAFTASSFSPDGKLIASADASGRLDLWSADTLKPLAELSGFEGQSIVGLDFSPDNSRILAYSRYGDIRVWDLARRSLILSFAGDIGWISRISFSGNGRRLLTIGSEGYKVWSAARGVLLFSLAFNQLWFADAALSADGDYLYTADTAGSTSEVWSVRSRIKLHSFDRHTGAVTAAALDSSGNKLFLASVDGTADLWNTRVNPIVHMDTAPDAVYSAFFMKGGSEAVLSGGSSTSGTVRIVDANTGALKHSLLGHGAYVRNADLSSSNQRFVAGSADGTASLWDFSTREIKGRLDHRPDMVHLSRISPDGKRIVTATYSATSGEHRAGSIWDSDTGQRIADLAHARSIYAISFSPDSRTLATASEDGTIKLWETDNGHPVTTLRGHTGPVISVAFHESGRKLASTGQDNSVRLWDIERGTEAASIVDPAIGWGLYVTFSPDGTTVAVGTQDSILLWRPAISELRTLKGHQSDVLEVKYVGNGSVLLSRSLDGTIRAWDPVRATEISRVAAVGGAISDMDISPNSQNLVASSLNYTAGIWSIAPEQRTADVISEILACQTKWSLSALNLAPNTAAHSDCKD